MMDNMNMYFIISKVQPTAYATSSLHEARFFYNLSDEYEVIDLDGKTYGFNPIKYKDFKYPHIIMIQNLPNKGKK